MAKQLLPLKYVHLDILSQMDKIFKGWKIKSTTFEDNILCINTDKYKNIPPRNNQIYTKIHFFRYHIYEKYTKTQVEIILGKLTPRSTQKIK